jgi:hypothetical protein
VHLVTLLEEMPVQETIDGVDHLHEADLPVGAIVINMTRPPVLPAEALARAARGDVDKEELAQGLKEASIDASPAVIDGLAAEATDHARRVELEQRERVQLAELGRATYELPLLSEAVDLGGLYRLAEMLTAQGMVPR